LVWCQPWALEFAGSNPADPIHTLEQLCFRVSFTQLQWFLNIIILL